MNQNRKKAIGIVLVAIASAASITLIGMSLSNLKLANAV
jgi:plastocyanin